MNSQKTYVFLENSRIPRNLRKYLYSQKNHVFLKNSGILRKLLNHMYSQKTPESYVFPENS